ncbi:MAG TPA: DUF6492 family protein [Gallionellaceae bacterium]
MGNISIFCKSYRGDLTAAATMVESVRRFNRDCLPLFIAVPEADLAMFKERIGNDYVNWLTDEQVIATNPDISLADFHALPGHISQQIVKAEFWRVNPQDNYVCIDSDSRFIRDFQTNDFIAANGEPYTILHEGKPFMQFCLANGIHETEQFYEKMSQNMREVFGRHGPSYSYNPFPVIWSRKVWQDLAGKLKNEGSNMLAAIVAHPYESSWYGEALLKFQSIPLLPKEPIFKAYLYLEEYEHDRGMGIDEAILARHYMGVVYQSNWYPHRLKPLKRLAYKLKRRLKRWRA